MQLVRLVRPVVPVTFVVLAVGLGVMLAMPVAAAAQTPPPKAKTTTPPPKKGAAARPLTEAEKAQLRAQAQALSKFMHGLAGAIKGNQAQFLQASLILMASADSDYNGHRGRAMNEVNVALGLLGAKGSVQAQINAMQARRAAISRVMAANLGGINVNQNLSDAELVRALHVLRRVHDSLVQTAQPRVDLPVRIAIREVEAALRWSASHVNKGAEAAVLTQAYILLSAANNTYDGHRDRARRHVEEALNSLDAQILVGGTVVDKVRVLREGNIATLAALKAEIDPALHEPQVISDVQMLVARALLQQVFFVDGIANGAFVRSRLRLADREIGLGLTVN
jgi:hypothetical protein